MTKTTRLTAVAGNLPTLASNEDGSNALTGGVPSQGRKPLPTGRETVKQPLSRSSAEAIRSAREPSSVRKHGHVQKRDLLSANARMASALAARRRANAAKRSTSRRPLPTCREIVEQELRRSTSGEASSLRERTSLSATTPTAEAIPALQRPVTATRGASTPITGQRVKRIRHDASPGVGSGPASVSALSSGAGAGARAPGLQNWSAVKREEADLRLPSTGDGSHSARPHDNRAEVDRKRVPRVDIMLRVKSEDLEHRAGPFGVAGGAPVRSAGDRGGLSSHFAAQVKREEVS
jgi:hypothetical protein